MLRNCLARDTYGWGDCVKQGAVEGLAATREIDAIPLMVAACRESESPSVRRAGIVGLGKVRTIDDREPTLRQAREAIERTLDAFDTGIRISAVRALASLRDPAAIPAVQRIANQDLDGRVRRAARESLREMRDRNTGATELNGLRDEVETLRTELRDLRTRLSTVEAKHRSS